MTYICVSKLTIICSDNGLSPDRRQAIVWTNAGILLIGPLGTNFSEISIEILTFSFKKMHLKVLSVKRRPFCLSLNVLTCELTAISLKVLMKFIRNMCSEITLIKLLPHHPGTYKLTHCCLVTPYGDIDLGQHCHGSSNGLLPDGTKPLPETMLTYHWWSFVVFTRRGFCRKHWRYQFMKWFWKWHF